jgi:hypothetical protein
LAAAGSSLDRHKIAAIPAISAMQLDDHWPRKNPELRIPTAQLKREWSLWPEFGWIRGICATFQRDILRRRF